MSIKQTIRNLMAGFLLLLGVTMVALPVNTYADCGGVKTGIINCAQTGTGKDIHNTGLWGILLLAINILTAGVGVVALAGIVYGAILYTSAGGNQEQVKKAITVFTNVAIGIIAFAGMWALLNFLIPGGYKL
jgi:hypothetical protein